jgi:hypothetical protein
MVEIIERRSGEELRMRIVRIVIGALLLLALPAAITIARVAPAPAIVALHHEVMRHPGSASVLRVVWEFSNPTNATLYVLIAPGIAESDDDTWILDHSARSGRSGAAAEMSFIAVPARSSAQRTIDYVLEPSRRRGAVMVDGRFGYSYTAPERGWAQEKNWEKVKSWQLLADAELFMFRGR